MCLLLHVVTVNQRMKSATGTQEPLTHTEIHHSGEVIEWKRDGRLEQKPWDSKWRCSQQAGWDVGQLHLWMETTGKHCKRASSNPLQVKNNISTSNIWIINLIKKKIIYHMNPHVLLDLNVVNRTYADSLLWSAVRMSWQAVQYRYWDRLVAQLATSWPGWPTAPVPWPSCSAVWRRWTTSMQSSTWLPRVHSLLFSDCLFCHTTRGWKWCI